MAGSASIWATLKDALDTVLAARETEPRGPDEEIVYALLTAAREVVVEMPQEGVDFTVEVI
jgi:hypothetical protein